MLKKIIITIGLLIFCGMSFAEGSKYRWECTAFTINNKGYIATAGHCVKGATNFALIINKRLYIARLIGADYSHDVAILKSEYRAQPYKLDNNIKFGEKIYILGFPLGAHILQKHYGYTEGREGKDFHFTGTLCHGDSGGPIINSSNHVIGVLTEGIMIGTACSHEGLAHNIGYIEALAIKNNVPITIDNTKEIVSIDEIIDKGQNQIFLFIGG